MSVRVRAEARLGPMMAEQEKADSGDAMRVARVMQKPELKPTLADAGINKNLARHSASVNAAAFAVRTFNAPTAPHYCHLLCQLTTRGQHRTAEMVTNARQFVSRVYWPSDRTERIEDIGSPQRAYGPDRCLPPQCPQAVGTILGHGHFELPSMLFTPT
jgi:hypothetical protein